MEKYSKKTLENLDRLLTDQRRNGYGCVSGGSGIRVVLSSYYRKIARSLCLIRDNNTLTTKSCQNWI